MKLKYIIASLLALGITLSSCNDDFMQRDPALNESEYFKDEAQLRTFLDGMYDGYVGGHMRGGTNQGPYGMHGLGAGSPLIYNDVYTDNAVATGMDNKLEGTYNSPIKYAEGSNGFRKGTAWEWSKLKRVNFFLRNYMKAAPSVKDPASLDKYVAEAYFFKAWDYYEKVVAFGQAPWLDIDLNIDSPELYSPHSSRVVIAEKIIPLLDFAIKNLDEKVGPSGTINKDMARFLKARYCLFEGSFRKYHKELGLESTANDFFRLSEQAANEIISRGVYELYDTPQKDGYRKLFAFTRSPEMDGNKEAILARSYDGTNVGHDNARYFEQNSSTRKSMGMPLGLLEEYLCSDGKPIFLSGGPVIYQPNPLFLGYDGMWDELENRDPRLKQTISKPGENISIYNTLDGTFDAAKNGIVYPDIRYSGGSTGGFGTTVTGYRFIKHWVADPKQVTDNEKGTQTAVVFRYGELLLIYAEAKAELGEFTQSVANQTINDLRKRAGFAPSAYMDITNLPADPRLDKIYSESLDYSVPALIREIRRERRVELVLEDSRYEDLMRWKAGNLYSVPARGMKMTAEKRALYDGRTATPNTAGIKETTCKANISSNVYLDDNDFIVAWGPGTRVVKNGILPWTDKRYYYPISLNELSLNKNLTQNPGWLDIQR